MNIEYYTLYSDYKIFIQQHRDFILHKKIFDQIIKYIFIDMIMKHALNAINMIKINKQISAYINDLQEDILYITRPNEI